MHGIEASSFAVTLCWLHCGRRKYINIDIYIFLILGLREGICYIIWFEGGDMESMGERVFRLEERKQASRRRGILLLRKRS